MKHLVIVTMTVVITLRNRKRKTIYKGVRGGQCKGTYVAGCVLVCCANGFLANKIPRQKLNYYTWQSQTAIIGEDNEKKERNHFLKYLFVFLHFNPNESTVLWTQFQLMCIDSAVHL